MKRYLPSSRTRSSITTTSALGDQLIREFTKQAQSIMQELATQFTDTLQQQSAQIVTRASGFSTSGTADVGGTVAGSNADQIGGIGQLLNTGARYLISRPRTSTNTAETGRSIDTASQFRVSTAQSAAEAQQMLNRGSKNL